MDMFTIDNIKLDASAANKDEALKAVSDFAVERGYADDAAGVLEGIQAREALMSTALMDGIAIPHAKHPAIHSAALLVVRFAEPMEWSDQDVTVALAMLVPESEAGTTHLKLLAQVSRALIEDDIRATLTGAATAQEIYDALSGRIG